MCTDIGQFDHRMISALAHSNLSMAVRASLGRRGVKSPGWLATPGDPSHPRRPVSVAVAGLEPAFRAYEAREAPLLHTAALFWRPDVTTSEGANWVLSMSTRAGLELGFEYASLSGSAYHGAPPPYNDRSRPSPPRACLPAFDRSGAELPSRYITWNDRSMG